MKPTSGFVVLAVALSFGLLIAWQITYQQTVTHTLEQTEGFELAALQIAELAKNTRKLDRQRSDLERLLAELAASGQKLQAGRTQAEAREATYAVILGSVPVRGPGIELIFTDQPVTSAALIDVMNALKNLGAEAIAINGQRFGPTSSIDDGQFAPPVTIQAIGEARVLDEGLRQTGGVLQQIPATATIARHDTLTLPGSSR